MYGVSAVSAQPKYISSLPPRLRKMPRSGSVALSIRRASASRAGSLSKSKVFQSQLGSALPNAMYFMNDSGKASCSGFVPAGATSQRSQPLPTGGEPKGGIPAFSAPTGWPGKNGAPLLTTPPYIFFSASAWAVVTQVAAL